MITARSIRAHAPSGVVAAVTLAKIITGGQTGVERGALDAAPAVLGYPLVQVARSACVVRASRRRALHRRRR